MLASVLILSICIIFYFEFLRRKKERFDFYTLFLVFFLLMYFIPISLWWLHPDYHEWNSYVINLNLEIAILASIVLLGVSIFTAFGFYLGQNSNIRINLGRRLLDPDSISRFVIIYTSIYFLSYIAALLLSGGVFKFVSSGIGSRVGEASMGLSGYIRYFLVSGEVFIPYLLIFTVGTKRYRIIKFIVLLAFIFAVFSVAVSTGSRAALIYPFMVVFFYWLLWSGKLTSKLLFFAPFVIFLGLLSINYAKVFLYDISTPMYEPMSLSDSLINMVYYAFSYFKHYLITIGVALKNPEVYEYPRAGIDYLRALIEVFPGVGKSDVDFLGLTSMPAELNKEYLGGNGYVPPGWVAFALMSGGVPFLILYCLFSSFIGGVIDRSFPVFNVNRKILAAHKVLFFYLWFRVFYAQDPWQVFLANFGLYLIFFVWLIAFRYPLVIQRKPN